MFGGWIISFTLKYTVGQNNIDWDVNLSASLQPQQQKLEFRPYFDAIALPHGDPHWHADGRDAAEDVQQGEAETLAVLSGSSTGKAGTAPAGETTLTRKETHTMSKIQMKIWGSKCIISSFTFFVFFH